MIFTDSEGRKFELVESRSSGQHVIQPIKTEYKWEVVLNKNTYNKTSPQYYIGIWFDATKDQAQLIKKWISAGLEYIFTPVSSREDVEIDISIMGHQAMEKTADKARQSLQKGAE